MKKIILLFVFFIAVQGFAQTNGISYQAIIMNPKGEQLPGVNNANSPVVNKNICMVFKFVDEFSNIEYQETVQTQTDGFGMVNLVIGKGTQTAGYAASFQSIVWSSSKKSLIVGINTDGNCATYTEISNQEFSYVPLAFSAINAQNVTGVVAIENGGTNAVTVLGARTNLQINNVDNTADLNKPVSTATQTALNLKENTANKSTDILIDGNSDIKYPSVKSVKMYVDGKLLTSSNALDTEINRATIAENTIAANLVAETNNRTAANNTLTTSLATEVTNRTAADLLKEDVANKSTNVTTDGTSDTKYPSVKSVKTYVDASTALSSTALANEVTRATAAENTIAANLTAETTARTSADATLTTNLATEVTNRTAADLLKEDVANKSTNVTTDGTSDTKYPSVKSVKTYVDTNAASASTALANEVSRATAAENTIATNLTTETSARTSADATLTTNLSTEVTNRTAADLLKEDLANKSTNVTTDGTSDTKYPSVKSVKTYVDAGTALSSTALTNEITRATTAENTVAANLTTETAARTSADATLTTNLATEVTNRTVADLLKEDVANKSTNVTTDGTSDTKYPSVKSVKIYVDASTASASTDLTNEVSRATAAENTIATNLTAETAARTSADATLQTNINAVQTDVDANEAAANTALNLKANLASPTLTGAPLAPTATAGTNTTQIATTAFVTDAITTSSIPDASTTVKGKIQLAGDLSGTAALPTITNNAVTSSKITDGTIVNADINAAAAIAYSKLNLSGSIVTSDLVDNAITTAKIIDGAVTSAKIAASPSFTGTPVAPTATAGTNSTQIATTAFVTTAITGSFVDLTTNQTVAGTKTFSSDLTINSTKYGRGAGSDLNSRNIAIGNSSLSLNSTGSWNTAVGTYALQKNTGSSSNTAIGNEAISESAPGSNNTGVGSRALMYTSGAGNTSVGTNALINSAAGNNNTAIGLNAFSTNTTGSNNTAIGASTVVSSVGLTNATAIGYGATVANDNTIQLGNTSVTDVKTSGTLTAGTVTYPKTHGTSGQVLSTNGSGTLSWSTPSVATSANFVDLTTDQTIAGTKSFDSNLIVKGITVGASLGMMGIEPSNTLLGYNVTATNASESTVVGYKATANGSQSIALGSNASANQTQGISIGFHSAIGSGYGFAIGSYAQSNAMYSTALGAFATTGGNYAVALGYQANASAENSIAIGKDATVSTGNTIQLGNTSITSVKTSGAITANSYVKSGGTSSQYLMADGSVSTGPAAVREVTDEFTATVAQTSFTLTQTPSANSKVKMYVNGIRISNTAYSVVGTTFTYNPTNNGGYALSAGDRIQMDFYY